MSTTFSTLSNGLRDRLRILVADDHEVLRAAVCGQLVRLGHRVVEAANGRAAVEVAAQEPFDLVLLDIQMPEMDGFTAARLIRAKSRGPSPRIVGISGEPVESRDFADAGMDDFVLKPVRQIELAQILSHSLV